MMCQYFMPTQIDRQALSPLPVVPAPPAAHAPWCEQLEAQAPDLDAFITDMMVGNDQAATAVTYGEAADAVRRERGAAGVVGWQLGFAMAMAQEMFRRGMRTHTPGGADHRVVSSDVQYEIVAMLTQTLESPNEELGLLLLLVAVGQLSVDDAALLPSLPVAVVRERLARGVQALFARLARGIRHAA